jgi:putative transposase
MTLPLKITTSCGNIFKGKVMTYSTSSHTKYHNHHIVWITKYRYKVLTTKMRLRIREITRQICSQLGVRILKGVLSNNHVHMFVEIPPKYQ